MQEKPNMKSKRYSNKTVVLEKRNIWNHRDKRRKKRNEYTGENENEVRDEAEKKSKRKAFE